jgi:uncharacterized protein YoxC
VALFDFNITLALPREFFSAIDRLVLAITSKGNGIMEQIDELVATVADVKAKVESFGPAVDAFEARITDLIKNSGMSEEDKAKVAAAVADLKAVATTAQGAVDDAANGVDEAAGTPAP